MKINISILFGEKEIRQYEESNELLNISENISNYTFDTEKEKTAFLLGIRESMGWQDYLVVNNH